ncbi:MAG: hypothetical protein MPN21_14055 [Thermoanaerobaculia bacterium]|nr:hypothetical protein [Thermoanaerobaculia bacterium]
MTDARYMVPWSQTLGGSRLRSWVRHPAVAAVLLSGPALEDAIACRALTASIGAEIPPDGLPLFVAVDPHCATSTLRSPDPRHLALDLAAGGEDFDVTLKVLSWARPLAEMGIDMVLSPRFDRSQSPLDEPELAARLVASWTEALVAAGIVACAGPFDENCIGGPSPFGAAISRGLEAVFVDHDASAESIVRLRQWAPDLLIVASAAQDALQAQGSVRSSADLIPFSTEMPEEEIDSILETATSIDPDRSNLIDSLRQDWLT